MGIFATEFPIKNDVTKLKFFASAVAWVRGMDHSDLPIEEGIFDSYRDELVLISGSKEKFTVKALDVEHGFVIGARHEFVGDDTLNWRTEVVATALGQSASLRIRGQCFSSSAAVPAKTPRRPYFTKSVLMDHWGGSDGVFDVSDSPHFLSEDQRELASRLIIGEEDGFLPIIYLSRNSDNSLLIDPVKLSYDLGGMAHVVVEPSLSFSRSIADLCFRRNPYLGTIAGR